jgi:hypothetical protein
MFSPDANPDSWLDAELRNVSVPAGLLERLRQGVALRDDELEAALRDVPIPAGLYRKLTGITDVTVRLRRFVQMASAALLIIGIGLSYGGAIVGLVTTALMTTRRQSEPVLEVAIRLPSDTASVPVDLEGLTPAADGESGAELPIPVASVPAVPSPASWKGLDSPLRDMAMRFASVDPMLDRYLAAWPEDALLAPSLYDMPELKRVPGLVRQGVKMPMVSGVDPSFLTLYRVHPFLAPASHPQLNTSEVPLGVDASSLELTKRFLEDGELPPHDVLRTEEFLAAVDYGFPEPKQAPLGLQAAGAVSPFRGPGLFVVQFGVQARDVARLPRNPVRLILVVDVSASMRWGGRLEMVRKAIDRLVSHIDPEDRISIVKFSENAYVLAEDVGQSEVQLLRRAIGELTPRSSTNLAAGLRRAYAMAQQVSRNEDKPTKIVLLSDGLAGLDRVTVDRIEQRLIEAAAQGVALHVVDLAQDPGSSLLDPILKRFGEAGAGSVHRSESTNQVYWALLEVLSGQPQLVASSVRLRVKFNPRCVAGYRLVGHEALVFAGLKPASLTTDFYTGQQATALYEVVLRQKPEREVAVGELMWTDPATSEQQTSVTTLRRGQLSKTFSEAASPVQVAAVVAETAEVLRDTPEVLLLPNGRSIVRPRLGRLSLAYALETGRHLDSSLAQNESYVHFLSVIQQAVSAKPSRSGGR